MRFVFQSELVARGVAPRETTAGKGVVQVPTNILLNVERRCA